MGFIAAGALVVITVILALLFGALVELYRQVQNIQDQTIGAPTEIDVRIGAEIPENIITERFGAEADESTRHAILFLSDSCATCYTIARELPRRQSLPLAVMIVAPSKSTADEWLSRARLSDYPGVFYDANRQVAEHFGVSVSPSVLLFEKRCLVEGWALPAPRPFDSVRRWLADGGIRPFATPRF